MHPGQADNLRDVRGTGDRRLKLEIFSVRGDCVDEGVLRAGDGYWYPIVSGVPSFLTGELRPDTSQFAARHGLDPIDAPAEHVGSQALTNVSFSDKWRRFRKYGYDDSGREFLLEWYRKKFGLPDRAALESFYQGRQRVLEVGPGFGFNTAFIAEHCKGDVFALDISEAAYTAMENTQEIANATVVQADLMAAPFDDAMFDLVVADGVLHHTPDTRKAVEAVYAMVRPGGQLFFYVYKRMGAARVFCDEHIRERFSGLPTEECYAACEGLTELGRELSRLDASITLSRPIEVLGIPAGTHDVQRLFYYNFVKCFWNEAFDFETNNMVNFDWYHPYDAWQHSREEVEGWLRKLGVKGYAFHDANPNGHSVLLTRPENG